jgi:uncharacterized protein
MKQIITFLTFINFALPAFSQDKTYLQTIGQFRKNYINTHEVVKAGDRRYLNFFKINEKFKVNARVEKINDSTGFMMPTSGKAKTKYFRYGYLHFSINGKNCKLTVFRSESLMNSSKYRDYLFVPFTDLNSGAKSYGGGKYIDLNTTDIINDNVVLDFNKAYNPYCAYASGFNCPIPPRENALEVGIEAGEKAFGKTH